MFKIVILALLFIILFQLFRACQQLISTEKSADKNMVKALTWRISLSFSLLILMLIGYYLGWITPHTL